MTTREAAAVIGCSIRHVRALVSRGRVGAIRYPDSSNRHGYRLEIEDRDAVRYRDRIQTVGYPRGRPRN